MHVNQMSICTCMAHSVVGTPLNVKNDVGNYPVSRCKNNAQVKLSEIKGNVGCN